MKLSLRTNIPVTFKLLYDKPYVPDPHPEYGQSYSYKFAEPFADGTDVWFATENGHKLMQALHLKKGDTVEVLKEEFKNEKTNKMATRFRINGVILEDLDAGEINQESDMGGALQDIVDRNKPADIPETKGLHGEVELLDKVVENLSGEVEALKIRVGHIADWVNKQRGAK